MAPYSLMMLSGIALVLGQVACDDRSECRPTSICASSPRFQQAQIVSAWPARFTTDGAISVCDGSPADAVVVNALLVSSQHRWGLGTELDFDVSVRPADNLDGRSVEGLDTDDIHVGNGAVSVMLDCLNFANTMTNACEGVVLNRRDEALVRYAANTTAREVGHEVAVLVDLTGDAAVVDILRASAARLMRIANARDDVSVFGFDERMVACSVDTAASDVITCDGMPRPLRGRSNLWQAVSSLYDSLRTRPSESDRSKHIVVLANGPDTCAGENRESCTTPCMTVDPPDLVSRIKSDREDQTLVPIQIHFVQLDTAQHPGRDARQVAVACHSGGHYQFINASTMDWTTGALRDSVDTAVANVRYAWMGHWEFALPIPAYEDREAVPPGAMYVLQGVLEIHESSHLVADHRQFPFGIGQGMGAPSASNWDRRPTVLKPCTAAGDCGLEQATSCTIACSVESGLCPTSGVSVARPDLSPCSADDGIVGFCCGGDCRTNGRCEACDTP